MSAVKSGYGGQITLVINFIKIYRSEVHIICENISQNIPLSIMKTRQCELPFQEYKFKVWKMGMNLAPAAFCCGSPPNPRGLATMWPWFISQIRLTRLMFIFLTPRVLDCSFLLLMVVLFLGLPDVAHLPNQAGTQEALHLKYLPSIAGEKLSLFEKLSEVDCLVYLFCSCNS